MINPSVFFPDRPSGVIKRVPFIPRDLHYATVACDCNRPLTSAYKPEALPTDVSYICVTLKPQTLMCKEQAVVFWTGTCPECKTWFWHSTTWDWVGWMNDLETCKMLLNTIPLQHILSEHTKNVAGISIHAGTRLYFENGKLKRIVGFK